MYYLAPQISAGAGNEAMAYKVNSTGGKTRLITRAGLAPPAARSQDHGQSSRLTHSLAGSRHHSRSHSFHLEERKSERVSVCIVHQNENSGKLPHSGASSEGWGSG